MNSDEARQIARGAGLDKAGEAHLEQLAKSFEKSRLLTSQIPKDLHWTEEVAFVFKPLVDRKADP